MRAERDSVRGEEDRHRRETMRVNGGYRQPVRERELFAQSFNALSGYTDLVSPNAIGVVIW
jgi:hypothetical protein